MGMTEGLCQDCHPEWMGLGLSPWQRATCALRMQPSHCPQRWQDAGLHGGRNMCNSDSSNGSHGTVSSAVSEIEQTEGRRGQDKGCDNLVVVALQATLHSVGRQQGLKLGN